MNKHTQSGNTGHNGQNGHGHNIIHGLFRPTLLSRGLAALKSWQSRRVAIRELNAMPDALLRDIGIERYQIKNAVHNFGAHPEVFRASGDKTGTGIGIGITEAPLVQKAA